MWLSILTFSIVPDLYILLWNVNKRGHEVRVRKKREEILFHPPLFLTHLLFIANINICNIEFDMVSFIQITYKNMHDYFF